MSTTTALSGLRPVTVTHADRPTPDPAPAQPGADTRPGTQGRPGWGALGTVASLVINFGAPLLAYELLRPRVHGSATALALSGAIPVVYTLIILAIRRRFDPLGVISVAGFAIGVGVSWASGGSTLALNLQDPALTGVFGLVCLVSFAIGRPLHPVILRLLGRSNPKYAEIATRTQHRSSMLTTAVIGVTFLGHAVAVAILALTQSESTFVALENPVGLPIFGLGIAVLFFYRSRLQAQRAAAEASPPAASTAAAADDQPGEQS